MTNDTAIRVNNVSKVFKLPHEKNTSIKSAVVNFYKRNKNYERQRALDDVSFEIKKGEFFGIVGRNGSGKSTLLKLLAGIYAPTNGTVDVNGSLTPFIELGVGFNPELTGRGNVYLNGALLGFSRKEMQAMYKDIVEFAELEKFMDQKLKNYSSGMQVRLAFSIAVRAQSDILILDEVLAVGDASFQRKCYDYFKQIKKTDKTVVLVSHDMDAIKKFCSRAALITQGTVSLVGNPDQVSELYTKQNEEKRSVSLSASVIKSGAEISLLKITNSKSKDKVFNMQDKVCIRMIIKTDKPMRIKAGINILKQESNELVAGVSSQFQIKPQLVEQNTPYEYEFEFDSAQLAAGNFFIDGIVYDADTGEPIFFQTKMEEFTTVGIERGWGALNLNGQWRAIKSK